MNVHDYQRFSEEVWQRNFHDVDIEHLQEKSSIEREERDVASTEKGAKQKRDTGRKMAKRKRCQGKELSREEMSGERGVKEKDLSCETE